MKKQPTALYGLTDDCPFQIGQHLWVRETCRAEELKSGLDGVRYLADNTFISIENSIDASDRWLDMYYYRGGKSLTVPSIHMPKWATRIWLEVTDVRVERVQEISPADCEAEGIVGKTLASPVRGQPYDEYTNGDGLTYSEPTLAFAALWDTINQARGYGWNINPWAWVTEFVPLDITSGGVARNIRH